jgi:hypothetical protein
MSEEKVIDFEKKLTDFEQTTWYDILKSIVEYFCTKVNIHKYKLHNLTHLDYFFYIILRYFTENPGELKELVEKKLTGLNELETYDITMSKNDITDARELFRLPHYNNMYLLFMYMFKRLAYIIDILDLQINDFTIDTKLQTFTRAFYGPFINFSIAFCNYVDILAFLLFCSLFPLNLQNQLTSDLYLLYHNNEISEQSKNDSQYRKNLFTQLQKTPNTDNQIINNKNQLFFFTTDQPEALYSDINTTKSLVNLYKIILILRLSINRPSYCESEIIKEFRKCLFTKQSSLVSLYPISSLTDLFVTKDNDTEYIKKEIREKQKSEQKILEDTKLIKRCLKQSERKLSKTLSTPLNEILINLNKSYQSLTIENIKNIIKTHVNLYKQKCQSNNEVILVLVNLILDKTLELDDLNNLKNLAKFSQKLVNKTCIMNEDQKNIFIQEYDKLVNRKEKIVNTEEELNDIFQRMGIQDEYTPLDIYSMY